MFFQTQTENTELDPMFVPSLLANYNLLYYQLNSQFCKIAQAKSETVLNCNGIKSLKTLKNPTTHNLLMKLQVTSKTSCSEHSSLHKLFPQKRRKREMNSSII